MVKLGMKIDINTNDALEAATAMVELADKLGVYVYGELHTVKASLQVGVDPGSSAADLVERWVRAMSPPVSFVPWQ